MTSILTHRCIPLTLGGDHTLTYPILRAIAKKHGPVALIHVDAHADINDEMFGEKIAHGTPFRRAYDDGLLQNDKVFQIGLRGTGYSPEDFNWARDQGLDGGAGGGMLVQVADAADGRDPRARSAMRRSISPMTSTASTRPSRRAPARSRSAG